MNYRGRVGESKITGSLKGTLRTGFRMIGLILKYRLQVNDRVAPRRLAGLRLVASARPPCCRTSSTIDNYFVQDDFGVVQLLAGKPAGRISRAGSDVVDGRHLGLSCRTKSVRSRRCRISSPRSAARPRRSRITSLNIALHAANGLLVFAIGRRGSPGCVSGSPRWPALDLRAAAGAGRKRRLDHRPRRLDAGVLLHGVVPVRTRAGASAAGGRGTRRLSFCSSSRCSASRPRSRWCATLVAYDVLVKGERKGLRPTRGRVRAVRRLDARLPCAAPRAVRPGGAREPAQRAKGLGCSSGLPIGTWRGSSSAIRTGRGC